MAARKKPVTRKKITRKKATRKKVTGKKVTRKKVAKKATRKTARKKATRRSTAGRRGTAALKRIESELPANLRDFTKKLRTLLTRVEKQMDTANAQARRRLARLLRDASQLLGRVEALGPARWRKLTTPYRRDAQRLLRRLESAVVPAARRRKTSAR